ncbi:MAG: Maf family protein, partial [Bdellovibrionota bacterium]
SEKRLAGESVRKMVLRLACLKAHSALAKQCEAMAPFGVGSVVVAADTVVIAPTAAGAHGRRVTVLGKPRNERDAARMLGMLQGRTHTVLTGYCLMPVSGGVVSVRKRAVKRIVKSEVKIRRLSKMEIRRYVATGEPMDKAGGYAAQGFGMMLIERICGSYSNVVGLPMAEVARDLEEHFGISIFSGAT